jgi:hypothetical protein
MTTATCRQCGTNYMDYAADGICGCCKARVKLGRPPVAPLPRVAKAMAVYRRVRVTAPHSSRAGQVGIGRELACSWAVQFGDGRRCSFRKNVVEVLDICESTLSGN